MINKISSKTCSEVYYILTELKQFNKLPQEKQKYIVKNKDNNYKFKFNKNIPLQFQIKSKETRIVLSYLFLKYINKDEKLKKFALNNYKNNEQRYQEELQKKYNYDNLFKNRQISNAMKEENTENKEALIEIKDNIITRIIKKIRSVFKKRNN